MNKELDFWTLYNLVEEFFQGKGEIVSITQSEQTINCLLYGAFVFKCGIEMPRNNYFSAISIDSQFYVRNLFGKEISLNNNKGDIIKNLELVDKYCQLRLPDKYLEEYFKGINY